jgi:hypothetical protein
VRMGRVAVCGAMSGSLGLSGKAEAAVLLLPSLTLNWRAS